MNEADKKFDMRYDNAPIRSQKADKDRLDRVWSFFASAKVGVWLIVLTLLGALIGSIFPQTSSFVRPPGLDYYAQTYGTAGEWYYKLGLAGTYTSWWFKLLVIMLGTSIVIASIDRGVPLYKALKKQKANRTLDFLRRQKISLEVPVPSGHADGLADRLELQLKKQRFRILREGNAVLGEKNRWSRWGPYVNHVGLIIFLLVVLIRSFHGFTLEQYVSVLEGEAEPIGGTNYYVKNEKFTAEFYKPEELQGEFRKEQKVVPKLYETKAVLYECTDRCGTSDPVLKEVAKGNILVNKPLQYRGLSVYQFGYDFTPQVRSVRVQLKDAESGESYGQFTLRTRDPELSYQAGPYKLRLHNYYPEFAIGKDGEPTTLSAETPNAPAFVFQITGPGLPEEGSTYLYFPREIDKERFRQDELNKAVGIGDKLVIEAGGMEDVEIAQFTSVLSARSDRTVPYLLFGGIVCMIGLVMGFYWQHRRIWLRIEDGRVVVAAHANKNWHAMRRETERLLEAAGLDASGVRTKTDETKS
ncbi:cytochrome c biogenesis protein ResB [Paenibacillus thermotolerans]|uniref:cytochrome c biogenesis protein ResB n=1 Tax=Paenibacillus thermotolerans TaxID=3027807 RepID=UPI00236849A8|nr:MULTISPECIES: cytochrome c biogenesis protein ResB [unclassified Paenibacillus]